MAVTDARSEIDEARDRLAGEGRTIEDLATDEGEAPEQQLALIDLGGTEITTAVGGSKPDESLIKIKSISRPITGQLKRHETRTLLVTVRVGEVAFIDKFDDDGRPVGRGKRRATVTPISIVPVSETQADLILGQPQE